MTNFKYLSRLLSEYSLDELKIIQSDLDAAEQRRNEASLHEKFNVDRMRGNKKIPKMNFPPPNPAFTELKNEIETEIKIREQNVNP